MPCYQYQPSTAVHATAFMPYLGSSPSIRVTAARPSTTNTTSGLSACAIRSRSHGTHNIGFSSTCDGRGPTARQRCNHARANVRGDQFDARQSSLNCGDAAATAPRHTSCVRLPTTARCPRLTPSTRKRSAAPRKLAAWDQVSDTSDGASRLRAARVRTMLRERGTLCSG